MRILAILFILLTTITMSFAQATKGEANGQRYFDILENKGVEVETVGMNVMSGRLIKEGQVEVFVPLKFNPSENAGHTDFKVFGDEAAVLELFIFDEKGNLIYDSKLENKWSGRTNDNKLAPEGNYIYLIKARIVPGKTTKISGMVQLERN